MAKGRLLRVRLEGPLAELGKVPAADVANLILGIERALARASGHVLGRPVRPTGRWEDVIARSVDLRLMRLESGSLVQVLEIPDVGPTTDSLRLAALSLGQISAHVALSALGVSAQDYPDVARAWLDAAARTGLGVRHESIRLSYQADGIRRRVKLDLRRKGQLQKVVTAANQRALREGTLIGVLVEADFESMSARLRTPAGDAVTVTFDPNLADDIQLALRQHAHLIGEVRYRPDTTTAVSVHVRSLGAPRQLEWALPELFWQPTSIAQLEKEQGVVRLGGIDELEAPALSEDEIDLFLEAIRH